MQERTQDSTLKGLFVTRDNPGNTASYESTVPAFGRSKFFYGRVGGKKVDSFPPPLNPVTISEGTYTSKTLNMSIEDVPNWGSRFYSGQLGAVVAGLCQVPWQLIDESVGGHHLPDEVMVGTALQKAYANINTSDVNGQLFLAEFSETVSMLKNPLRGIQKIHAKYRKSRKRIRDLLAAETKVSADVYLQYMFGVQPLISEIQNIYAAAMDEAKRENRLYGKGSVKQIQKATRAYSLDNKLGFHNVKAHFSVEQRIKVTSKVYYKVTWESRMLDLVNKWGMNPILIPVTLWETLPLSFVLDWFFGVKLWLNAIAPKPGICTLGNYVSEKLEEEVKLTSLVCYVAPGTPSTPKTWVHDDAWQFSFSRLIRQVDLPMPNYPLVAQGLNETGKAISLAFLAIQKIKF